MDNRPIGVFDSGVGGLTIFSEIKKLLPHENIIFVADQANVPYSGKTKKELVTITTKIAKFLVDHDVKMLVVACNTASVYALDALRSKFQLPIIGIVPVVKTAAEETRNRQIGILSTVATSRSDYQKKLIEKFADSLMVINIGTDKLVPFIERGEFRGNGIEAVLNKVLSKFKSEGVDTLALGCSHFSFLRGEIREILGNNVLILDSGSAVARQINRVLKNNSSLASEIKPIYTFFTTGDPSKFKKVGQALLKRRLTHVRKATI